MALRHLALANRNWDQIRSTLEVKLIKLRASYTPGPSRALSIIDREQPFVVELYNTSWCL
jgi:hypothetical protein